MIAVDLPGFGETPPLNGEVSIATLTDSVGEFIREQGLEGVATVGQSMGGRMVLELARRGIGGDTVAKFPDAKLHWFQRCGHFPQWDAPHETIQLILDNTDYPVNRRCPAGTLPSGY